MNLTDLSASVERLDRLSRGLTKEVVLVRECDDPLLYQERQAYLGAIQNALSGVEVAWPNGAPGFPQFKSWSSYNLRPHCRILLDRWRRRWDALGGPPPAPG